MVSVAIQLFSTALFLPMEPSLLNNKMKRQLQVFTGTGLVLSLGVSDNLSLLTIPPLTTSGKGDFPLHIPDLPGPITVNQLPVIFVFVFFLFFFLLLLLKRKKNQSETQSLNEIRALKGALLWELESL